jgi:hypothetical protein
VRIERSGTKKLIVAFHFQFSNPGGWKCDVCRKSGLDVKRQCRFRADVAGRGQRRIVWARKGVSLETCPKAYISAESLAWLEAFWVWRTLGGEVKELDARTAEAFLILTEEWAGEGHGEQ